MENELKTLSYLKYAQKDICQIFPHILISNWFKEYYDWDMK